ncbi:hypothetical protein Golax_022730 [Gossypium laxum]|uniref:Uncharacterized protein n=1 Tax=Gossypium laxum TaxID=34288 RepID=A0A7J9B4K5_9ROSI|nr:hypothetical protein [Gossypium laxum]
MSALLFQLPRASRSTAETAMGSLCLQISSDRSFENSGEGHGVKEQHQSIPNLVVKLYCGDDTVGEGTIGNRSNGDEVGPVAQKIRARGYELRCWGFESLLAHNRPKREGPFPLGVGKS